MKIHPIATLKDLLLLAILVCLSPSDPTGLIAALAPPPFPHIPDKVEIRYRPARADSLTLQHISSQIEELQYYLRVHNVTDEGYNLIAQYYTGLLNRNNSQPVGQQSTTRRIAAKDRLLPSVITAGGHWRAGQFRIGSINGPAILRDSQGRIVCAQFDTDTIVQAVRTDSTGTYRGQMDIHYQACGQGSFEGRDGSHYEGFWRYDHRNGFGFESSPHHTVRVGEWRDGRFLGERMRYTAERIYGIDISRHQHEKGRKRYGIKWQQLRITSLGRRHDTEGRTYPVSFVYIKSTEGTTIRNRYFLQDYRSARLKGLHVGAYHFFSMRSTAAEQANYFVNHTLFRPGDFPPVMDVEPTEAQIVQIGGDEELMRRIRIFMQIVEQRTHMRPILYVSQMFINKHMQNAADIKKKYNVWIARYGQYKPDVHLVYWQLCPDGKVSGITGDVDINVFNGYQGQFDEFVRTGFHK